MPQSPVVDHHNVFLLCGIWFIISYTTSISFMNFFDTFLFLLSKSNEYVGFIESISGMTFLSVALPVGLVTDKYPKVLILKLSSIFGIFALSTMAIGVYFEKQVFLLIGTVLVAIVTSSFTTCGEALYSESVSPGLRSKYNVIKTVVQVIGLMVGPIIQIIMLHKFGNQWNKLILKKVLIFGLLLYPIVVPMCFCLKSRIMPSSRSNLSLLHENEHDVITRYALSPWKLKWIPFLLVFADFTLAVGAGMTVKFFPLFFKQDYDFAPIDISYLYVGYMCGIAISMIFIQQLSLFVGRAQSSMLWITLGTSCLYLMSIIESPTYIVVGLFILRGSLANARTPIDRSILMDSVPPDNIGKWLSVFSITRFTWSGSAFIGGWIADTHDYRYTFYITAIIYSIAALFYIPLIFWVPRKE